MSELEVFTSLRVTSIANSSYCNVKTQLLILILLYITVSSTLSGLPLSQLIKKAISIDSVTLFFPLQVVYLFPITEFRKLSMIGILMSFVGNSDTKSYLPG